MTSSSSNMYLATYLALTLDKLAHTGEDTTLCFRPLDPPVEMGVYVVWKKFQVFSRPAEAFLKLLRQQTRCEPLSLIHI